MLSIAGHKDMSFDFFVSPTRSLVEIGFYKLLEFFNGPSFLGVRSQKHGILGKAGKIIGKLGLGDLMKTVEECVGLVIS